MLDDIEIITIIDKEKLPEDVRKILGEKLPKDIQEKVLKMLDMHNPICKESKENKLFAIQTGMVVGNIYDKNFKLADMKNKGDS